MSKEPFGIPICDLYGTSTHWRRKIMPDDALHFMPPHGGGWGIVRTALELPESVVLMAAPPVCARNTGLRELHLNYKDRFFFLDIGDNNFANGSFEKLILKAVDEIMDHLDNRPEVFLFCQTCIDDIIGSDYQYLQQQVEQKYKIRSASLHLKPTTAEGRMPSGLLSQLSIFNMIKPVKYSDSGINILGSALPISPESEFNSVVKVAGLGPLRHVTTCKTVKEFDLMSASSWNILLRPSARLVIGDMYKKFGIPHISLPGAYSIHNVDKNYTQLETFFGRKLETSLYREECKDFISDNISEFRGTTAAVGGSVYTGAFELARALVEYGFDVRYIFANVVTDFDTEHLQWLKDQKQDIMLYPSSHTSMTEFHNLNKRVDIAFGYEAGYFCSEAPTVAMLPDYTDFGYRGIQSLIKEIQNTLGNPRPHMESMYESFLNRGRTICSA
jgi:nitrogenase molybdenum-cofactor synthesis protein NifE